QGQRDVRLQHPVRAAGHERQRHATKREEGGIRRTNAPCERSEYHRSERQSNDPFKRIQTEIPFCRSISIRSRERKQKHPHLLGAWIVVGNAGRSGFVAAFLTAGLEQEPGSSLRTVDEVFEYAGGRRVVISVGNLVRLAHIRDQLL